MEYISGASRDQIILPPESVEKYAGEESAARAIEAFVNSLDLEALTFFRFQLNSTGRPPYDPKDILKLYMYGNMHRIRSSRRLEDECKRNLEAIWLTRKLAPDHKTISDFRKDNPKGLKNVFRHFVRLCAKLGLYGKELAGTGGSKFKAANSKDRSFTGAKLKDRMERIDRKTGEYLKELDGNDAAEKGKKSAEEIKKIIEELKGRKTACQGYADELEETGETRKSLTDPESRLMPANGKMGVCYNAQTAVDSKNKLITEFEVTNNANDMNMITPMAEKVMEILETDAIAVTAGKGYASASGIAAAARIGAEPHVAGTDFDICVPVKEEEEQAEITSHNNGRSVYI